MVEVAAQPSTLEEVLLIPPTGPRCEAEGTHENYVCNLLLGIAAIGLRFVASLSGQTAMILDPLADRGDFCRPSRGRWRH